MRNLDFSSWQTLLSTLFGLTVITLIGVGVRLLAMQTIQHRRERENRQINERLRTLIAAYKTLGGSFTGDLVADPSHHRDLKKRAPDDEGSGTEVGIASKARSDRSRRIRDAVEAALSDIILLGTEEQVRLAAEAAAELAAGRAVETSALVVCLRDFIRSVLDLEPVPAQLQIPKQGPSRAMQQKGNKEGESAGSKHSGGGGGGGGTGGGGFNLGLGSRTDPEEHHP